MKFQKYYKSNSELADKYGFQLIEDRDYSITLTRIIEKMKKPNPSVEMLAGCKDSFAIFIELNYDITGNDVEYEYF